MDQEMDSALQRPKPTKESSGYSVQVGVSVTMPGKAAGALANELCHEPVDAWLWGLFRTVAFNEQLVADFYAALFTDGVNKKSHLRPADVLFC